MRPCKLFTLNIYWILLANINNKKQIFKIFIMAKNNMHTRRASQKITAINNLQRFVFFLARHLLRRKIWLTCMCEASVPCMCLYVYTLYLSRTFILSIKTSIHFHWDLTINSHEAKIVQQQQHQPYLESLYVLLQCTRAVYLCCTKTSCRQKTRSFLKPSTFTDKFCCAV